MEATQQEKTSIDMVRGKVIYVLALVVLVQTVYPITADGSLISNLIYQFLYALLMIAGYVVSRENQIYRRTLIALGVVWLITAIIFDFNQEAIWALMATYVVIIVFQIMVTQVLFRYIFLMKVVNRDVLYAATAVYFLLGAIFVPVYGIIETITFATSGGMHAFSDGVIAIGEVFPWQTFIYYSYSTLTTLGYGDILPITPWARSAASVEAIIGVLYLTIILARLVGLYAAEIENETEA